MYVLCLNYTITYDVLEILSEGEGSDKLFSTLQKLRMDQIGKFAVT